MAQGTDTTTTLGMAQATIILQIEVAQGTDTTTTLGMAQNKYSTNRSGSGNRDSTIRSGSGNRYSANNYSITSSGNRYSTNNYFRNGSGNNYSRNAYPRSIYSKCLNLICYSKKNCAKPRNSPI